MGQESIVQISAYPGWIVGVSRNDGDSYSCWVVDPNLSVMSDGRNYETSNAAMRAGRIFVESRL